MVQVRSTFIPASTADFRLYVGNNIEPEEGISGVALPESTLLTVSVPNNGNIDVPIPGLFDSMVATINISNLTDTFNNYGPGEKITFTVKWATVGQDRIEGGAKYKGNSCYIEGLIKDDPGGTISMASPVDASINIEVLTMLRTYDKKEIFYCDKLTGKVRKNGRVISDDLQSLL